MAKKKKPVDTGYTDDLGQIMHMPFDKLEAAFKARKRIHVLQRGIARETERLAKNQTRIQKLTDELKALAKEYS